MDLSAIPGVAAWRSAYRAFGIKKTSYRSSVERLVKHAKYGKYVRRTSKLLAHDEQGESREGDLVAIVECRPISKRKAWRVVEIIERAPVEAES